MKSDSIAICLLISLCVQSAFAVDASKFIKCEQSGFCRRNRAMQPGSTSDYSVVDGSIQVDAAGTSVSGEIKNSKGAELVFTATGFGEDSEIMRIQIDEKNGLHPRYRVQDIVMEDNVILNEAVIDSSNSGYTNVKFDGHVLRINHSPFSVQVYRGGKDLVLSAGTRGLFNFEHYRTKESENGQPLDGGWEETFGSHTDSKPRGPSSVGMDINFHGAAEVYGIPEHATTLALPATKGQGIVSEPFRMFNLDVFEYDLDSKMALYGGIPFMMGHDETGTAGVLWLNAAETWIDIEKNTNDVPGSIDTHWFSESGIVDLFFFVGPSPKDVLKQYGVVTGMPAMPQYFSIAYHQCRWNYKDEEDVRQVNAGFDEHDIPMDVMWLDIEHTNGKRYFTWDSGAFPTPQDMQNKLAEKGRKMVTIVDPHIKVDGGYNVHNEIKSKGLYIQKKDGGDYEGWCWPGSSGYPDFTKKEMREYWASKFAFDQYQGSTPALYTWNDMNEPSVFNGPEVSMHRDAVHDGGFEHRDVHNMYGSYVHMATAEGHVARSGGKDRPFVLSRAFFAGSQRFGAIWTGDNMAEWGHLKASNPMLLSMNIAGLPFVGADVGGFFKDPDAELMVRWYQAGAFQPFFRAHGHLDTKRREPWLWGDVPMGQIRDAIRMRYSLLPFWYSLFQESSVSGMPVMRPLFFEYPKESMNFQVEDQFILGSDLLVKPITAQGVTTTNVILPGTEPWFDYKTHTRYEGGQTVTVSSPIESGIPVFIRGGAIVPRRERIRRASSLSHRDPLTLVIALDSKNFATGRLYLDDGHSFEYKTDNKFILRQFTFNNGRLTSTNLANDASFETPVVIERLVFVGVSKEPSSVTIVGSGHPLNFTFASQSSTMVVRKPDLAVGEDWEVEVKF